jgi:dTDP-4-dehydrorhamnose reductase
MKSLVIGGSGQIGGHLMRLLAERGHETIGTYATVAQPGLMPLDAGRLEDAAAWVADQRSDVIFYPAGFTWVDGCERDPEKARASNRDQPLNLARAAPGARFVYFSTDYLFDGQNGPYNESVEPAPLSAYGRAKLEAEQALHDLLEDRLLIARTCWVYGPEKQGKNFAYQLIRTLASGKELTVPADQWSSPSYGPDVARAVVDLVEADDSGVIHVAGPETVSRGAFARAIAEEFGLDASKILERPTAELGQEAPRPLRAGLLTPRLDRLKPGQMRAMVAALTDFRERLVADEGWANPLEGK